MYIKVIDSQGNSVVVNRNNIICSKVVITYLDSCSINYYIKFKVSFGDKVENFSSIGAGTMLPNIVKSYKLSNDEIEELFTVALADILSGKNLDLKSITNIDANLCSAIDKKSELYLELMGC